MGGPARGPNAAGEKLTCLAAKGRAVESGGRDRTARQRKKRGNSFLHTNSWVTVTDLSEESAFKAGRNALRSDLSR